MSPRTSESPHQGKAREFTAPDLAPGGNSKTNRSLDVTVDTLSGDTTASMKMRTVGMAEKLMRIEERTLFLGELIRINRGKRKLRILSESRGV